MKDWQKQYKAYVIWIMIKMKLSRSISFFSTAITKKRITNIDIPVCKRCVYYRPEKIGVFSGYSKSTCEKFGEKNLVTGLITYNDAEYSRRQVNNCGPSGIHFEEDRYMTWKLFKQGIKNNLPSIVALCISAPFIFFSVH